MEQEFIYYVHDNSETLQDYFTIIANATDLRKHSTPRTVHVQVTPVNDEPPVITANKVLRVGALKRNAAGFSIDYKTVSDTEELDKPVILISGDFKYSSRVICFFEVSLCTGV